MVVVHILDLGRPAKFGRFVHIVHESQEFEEDIDAGVDVPVPVNQKIMVEAMLNTMQLTVDWRILPCQPVFQRKITRNFWFLQAEILLI